MYHNRVIPCLSLRGHGLVKTVQFKKGRYLGDPINAVKIYNDREVDELFIIDIDATKYDKKPDIDFLKKLTQQCFMPVGYAGGVKTLEDVRELFEIGFEKVAIGSAAYLAPNLIQQASKIYGSQSIVGVIDVRKQKNSWSVYIQSGTKKISGDVVAYAKILESKGVGELFINSIEHDGMMNGYDYELISLISKNVRVPVVACGGASSMEDCAKAINSGASAVSAGSLFVYWGRKKAVLINYPDNKEISKILDF